MAFYLKKCTVKQLDILKYNAKLHYSCRNTEHQLELITKLITSERNTFFDSSN